MGDIEGGLELKNSPIDLKKGGSSKKYYLLLF
jgi:hypothetical protein